MKNKVIRGVLAAACVTTAVSAANVFGAGTEQSLVNEASAVTQEETEETSEAETTDENTPEMTETETPDSTVEIPPRIFRRQKYRAESPKRRRYPCRLEAITHG